MEVQFVLEISAIALIISAIMSYITFRKSSSLTYITQERKEWRENIRKISEDMEGCSYKKRNQVLVKLKTRINVYGYMRNGELNDAHIWKVIDQIECCTQKEYDILKEKLICYLSALLKYDWERSKKEVHGEPIGFIRGICIVAMIFFFSLSLLDYVGAEREKAVPQIVFLVVCLCVIAVCLEMAFKDVVVTYTKKNIVVYVVVELIILIAIIVSGIYVAQQIGNEYMNCAFFAAFVADGFRIIENLLKVFDNVKYCECVRGIEAKYTKNKGGNKVIYNQLKCKEICVE